MERGRSSFFMDGCPLLPPLLLPGGLLRETMFADDQADLFRDRLPRKTIKCLGISVFNDAGHNVVLAADGTSDQHFAGDRFGGSGAIRPGSMRFCGPT